MNSEKFNGCLKKKNICFTNDIKKYKIKYLRILYMYIMFSKLIDDKVIKQTGHVITTNSKN